METDQQPGSIAESIFGRASVIRGMNASAKVHISAIVKSTDLVDDTDSTTNANEKIETTNSIFTKRKTFGLKICQIHRQQQYRITRRV